MEDFHILFTRQAAQEFQSLPKKVQIMVKANLDFLSIHPEMSGVIKSFRKIVGIKNGYRIRVGRYRILYLLFVKKREIWICSIFLKKKPRDYADLIKKVIERGVVRYE